MANTIWYLDEVACGMTAEKDEADLLLECELYEDVVEIEHCDPELRPSEELLDDEGSELGKGPPETCLFCPLVSCILSPLPL